MTSMPHDPTVIRGQFRGGPPKQKKKGAQQKSSAATHGRKPSKKPASCQKIQKKPAAKKST